MKGDSSRAFRYTPPRPHLRKLLTVQLVLHTFDTLKYALEEGEGSRRRSEFRRLENFSDTRAADIFAPSIPYRRIPPPLSLSPQRSTTAQECENTSLSFFPI